MAARNRETDRPRFVSSHALSDGSCWYPRRVRIRPDTVVDRVEDLDAAWLTRENLRALMVDLDETLVPAGSLRPSRGVRRWAAGLAEAGVRLLILSNGTPARVRAVARLLDIDGLALVGKPWAPAYRRGLARLGLPARQVAMVGDQLFTDVLGARSYGLRTVLVTPLSSAGLPHTRMLRSLEDRVVRGGGRGRPVHR